MHKGGFSFLHMKQQIKYPWSCLRRFVAARKSTSTTAENKSSVSKPDAHNLTTAF